MARNDPSITLKDWRGGINTALDPVNIRDNQFPEGLNVDPWDGDLVKRLGMNRYGDLMDSFGYGLDPFIQANGTKRLITQMTQFATTSGSAQRRSLLFEDLGTGPKTVLRWYAAGTATFTAGSAAVTGLNTFWKGNLASPTEFWIRRPGDATDAGWYLISAVASDGALTMDTIFAGTGGAGPYEIVKPFLADQACFSPGVSKDNFFVCQIGSQPQRYDGDFVHRWGNTKPTTAPTVTDDGAGNVDQGVHRILYVYFYGTFSRSEPGPSVAHNTNPPLGARKLKVTPLRGPQEAEEIWVYAQKAGVDETEPYYFVDSVENDAAVLDVTYNVADTDLDDSNVLEEDLGQKDQGFTAPLSIKMAMFDANRCFAVDADSGALIISRPDLPTVFPQGNTKPIQPDDGEQIGGLAVNSGRVIILKDISRQYYLTEPGPSAGVQRIDTPYGCVAPKTVDYHGAYFLFLSSEGLCLGTVRGSHMISKDIRPSIEGTKQSITRFGHIRRTSRTELEDGATLSNCEVTDDGQVVLTEQGPFLYDDNGSWSQAESFVNCGLGGQAPAGEYPEGRELDKVYLFQVTDQSLSQQRDLLRNDVVGIVPAAAGWSSRSNAIDVNANTRATHVLVINPLNGPASVEDESTYLEAQMNTDTWKVNKWFAKLGVDISTSDGRQSIVTITVTVQAHKGGVWTTVKSHVIGGIDENNQDFVSFNLSGTFNTADVDALRVKFHAFLDSQEGAHQTDISCYIYTLSLFEAAFLPEGTVLTEVFDSGVNEPSYGPVDLTYSIENNTGLFSHSTSPLGIAPTVEMSVRTGPAGSPNPDTDPGWSGWVTQPNHSNFQAVLAATSKFGRYSQIALTLKRPTGGTAAQNGSVTPVLESLSLAYMLDAEYETEAMNPGGTPTNWDRVFLDYLPGGGSIVSKTRTGDTDPPDGSWSVYATFENGQQVPSPEAARIQLHVDLIPGKTPSTARPAPSLQQFEIRFYMSLTAASAFPAVGKIYKGKYYLAMERYQSDHNDRVFVCDLEAIDQERPLPWTIYDWKMNGLAVMAGSFYGAHSQQAKIVQLLVGTEDDGVAIDFYAWLKPALFDAHMKKFLRAWIMGNAVKSTSAPVTLNDEITVMFNRDPTMATTTLRKLAMNQKLSGQTMIGDGSTGQRQRMTAVSGALAIQHSFSAARMDHRLVGHGPYLQVGIMNNLRNKARLSITGVQIQYSSRKLMGNP